MGVGALLRDSYEPNLLEFFHDVWELLIEVTAYNNLGSLVLLYDIPRYF